MKKLYPIFILITTMIIAQPGVTEIPYTMSFQGILKDADGNIYENGEYSLTFRLFDFKKPSKAICGALTFGPLIICSFCIIFSGIPSIIKTSLLGVE